MTTTEERLAQRYGRPAPGARRVFWGVPLGVLIAAGVVLVVFLAAAVEISLRTGAPAVSGALAGAEIVDATHTTVQFDVTLRDGHGAVCRIRALNERSTVVGWQDVEVAAAGAATTTRRVEVTLRTTEIARQGDVQGCSAR